MDKRQMSVVIVSAALVFVAVTAVTATSKTPYTPLYTYRMEHASNELHFSPAAANDITYSAGTGYTLNYEVEGYGGDGEPCGKCTEHATTCRVTCVVSCLTTCDTCLGWTCWDTSCQPTCWTCDPTTCQPTCESTCMWTCDNTTCEIDCVP